MHGLFTLLVTVLSSGLVATIVAFFFNSQLAERNTRRQKLEELYSLVHGQWTRLNHQVSYLEKIQQDPSTIQAAYNEMQADSAWRSNANERVVILIAIYFPNLLPMREAMNTASERALAILCQHTDGDNESVEVIDRQRKCFDVLAALHSEFLAEVYITAAHVNRPLWKFWR